MDNLLRAKAAIYAGFTVLADTVGGFVGPLATGIALDWFGDTPLGWGIGFGHVAVTTLAGLWVLRRLGR